MITLSLGESALAFGDGGERIVLVAGATGRQGAEIARHLLRNNWRVRALTRNPNQAVAHELAAAGAQIVIGDLDDSASLSEAADGAYGVYSVQNFWMHGFHREIVQGKHLADAALRARVGHFVYSSAGGVGRVDGLGITHLDSKAVIERYVVNIGLPYTILRPVTFFENFITPRFIRRIFSNGVLLTPIDPCKDFQMVAARDVGALGALAFGNREAFLYRVLEVASDFFSMDAFAETIGRRIGHPVRHRKLPAVLLWLAAQYVERTNQTARFGIGKPTFNQIRWNNRSAIGGWAANIGELRRIYPRLTRMEKWVSAVDWEGLRVQANRS